MKKKLLTAFLVTALGISMLSGCGGKNSDDNSTKSEQSTKETDQEAADKVAKLIDDIYVQERTDKTDEQCKAAKEAWDKLTDAQKELVEGENADPDYFGAAGVKHLREAADMGRKCWTGGCRSRNYKG